MSANPFAVKVNPFASSEDKWSYTRLDRFSSCPRKYWLMYERTPTIPDAPTEESEFGSLAHEMLQMVLTKKAPTADIQRLAASLGIKYPLLDSEAIGEAAEIVARFANAFSPTGKVKTEQKLEVYLDGILVQVYLDLVEVMPHAVRITDFKTSWEAYKPSEKKQMPLYAAAMSLVVKKPIVVRHWFLRKKRNPAIEEPATEEMIADARAWLKEKVAEIQKARLGGEHGFAPVASAACNTCNVGLACVGFRQEKALNLTQAKNLAEACLRLEAARQAAVRELKGWVTKHGPLKVNDEYFGHYPRVVFKASNAEKVAELLTAAGISPWPYLSLNSSKTRDDWDRLQQVLSEVVSRQVSMVFDHRGTLPSGLGETGGSSE